MTEVTTHLSINSTQKLGSDPFINSLHDPDVSGVLYVVLEVSIIGFIGMILYYFSSREKNKNESDPERPVLLSRSPEEISAPGDLDKRKNRTFSSSTPQFLISNYSGEGETQHSTPRDTNVNPSLLTTPDYRQSHTKNKGVFVSARSHIPSLEASASTRSHSYASCQEMSTPSCGQSPDAFMSAASHVPSTNQLSPDPSSNKLSPDAFMSAKSRIPSTYSTSWQVPVRKVANNFYKPRHNRVRKFGHNYELSGYVLAYLTLRLQYKHFLQILAIPLGISIVF